MNKENVVFDIPGVQVNWRSLPFSPALTYRDMHFHEEVELVRVDKGRICCVVEEDAMQLVAGQVLLINSCVPHKLYHDHCEASATYLHVNMHSFAYGSDILVNYRYVFGGRKGRRSYAVYEAASLLWDMFATIEQELAQQQIGFAEYVKAYANQLYAFMIRHGFCTDVQAWEKNRALERMLPVLDYVDENFSRAMGLDAMARLLSMDKHYFCKLFKEATGTTFIQYVNDVRLMAAQRFLVDSNRSVADIALSCGFASVPYFNKVFKARNGYSPKTYRQMGRRENE